MAFIEHGLNPYRHQDPSLARSYERQAGQCFNRVAFALRALGLFKPAGTRVLVFTSRRLELQQGRDLIRGPDARWVMLGVPRDASRESIVMALTKINGLKLEPYSLDTTLCSALLTETAN